MDSRQKSNTCLSCGKENRVQRQELRLARAAQKLWVVHEGQKGGESLHDPNSGGRASGGGDAGGEMRERGGVPVPRTTTSYSLAISSMVASVAACVCVFK